MSQLTVVYDACVLYPAPLRDLLMHLAVSGLFAARWSDMIHAEWMRSVLAARPDLSLDQLERTRGLMNAHAADSLVSGFEHLIDRLELPDVNDRHVLAAAIHAQASIIVTFNLKHFPAANTRQYGIEAQHPDRLVCDWIHLEPEIVCQAVRQQRKSLKRPALSVDEFLSVLDRQQLANTVAALRQYTDRI